MKNYDIIFIENKEREKITMYGYNKKELINFIKEQVCGELSIASVSERGYTLPGYLGQGISRTTLAFSKYPNIVFKICVGSDGDVCIDDAEKEAERWKRAVEEDVAPYFAETEYLCDIELYNDTWKRDEYGDIVDCIDYSQSYEVPVYIQAKVDDIWCDSEMSETLHTSKNTLQKEKKIYRVLETYISDVDDDEAFSALFIRKYGIKEYKKLAKFIYDYDVEDLHGANWGIKDNDLVIIDYAM